MKTLSYDECIDITESYAYLNIPISVIQYCTARISRSAFTLWIKLRDMTKYLTNWAISITNKLLGRYIYRSEHRAYMLLRELEDAGLIEKKHDLGKSCTIYVRMPEAIKNNPVLKSNTPCKNTGGHSSILNNNYVINNNTTTVVRTIEKAACTVRNFFVKQEEKNENHMTNDPINNPANWQKMKEEYTVKLEDAQKRLKELQKEPADHPFTVLPGETMSAYHARIAALPKETILRGQDKTNSIIKLESYISSVNIAISNLNDRLNGIGKPPSNQKPQGPQKASNFMEPAKYADRRNYPRPVDNRRTTGYNSSYRTYNPD